MVMVGMDNLIDSTLGFSLDRLALDALADG
jgi:hypothetical protein